VFGANVQWRYATSLTGSGSMQQLAGDSGAAAAGC